jgi:hypothetical protein
MSLKFNPFSGNFDFTGAGGGGGGGGGGASYIDGEVATYADLPLDVSAALNSAWLVREASGVWPVSRKQAGIYIRTATGGSSRDADYTYAGTMPDVFSDAQFTLYGDVDSTKNVKFDVDAQVGANQTRVITVPNKNITLDDAGDSRSPTSHTHGNLTNAGAIGTTANLPLRTGTSGVIEAGSFGTSAGSFCAGDDARLSDARTPTAHAASHAAGGSDPVFDQDLNTDSDPQFNSVTATDAYLGGFEVAGVTPNRMTFSGDEGITFYGDTGSATRTNLGAAASGSITTSGLTQATARILGRTTASTGAVEEIQIGSGLSLSAGELSSTVSAGIPATLLDAKGDLVVASAADTAARLPVGGTNGHVLTVDSNETLGVKWAAAAGGGSGGTKTYAVFTATDNQPPATAFATLDTRNSIAVLDFDAATDESAVFVGVIPEGASLGSGLKVFIHWMASTATSDNCRWGVQFEKSGTDLDSDSFDTAAEAHSAANGTSGIETVTEITITTIDSLAAGDRFRLKVFRNADDATNDTMTGDAELVAVEVRSAA